ncbi:MAG: Ycf66 family protein [Cyanobacteriota bacterium]|nr:Ycf66 family protein [Cyanobacteriota bacterium]
MVNFGFGLAGFVGLALVASGVGLYVLRSVRPTLARDHDIFFAAVALLCGGILMFQGWRLDPILLFGQFLMTGSAAFFAVESIRLRGIVTQQAKRNTPIVDDDRSVSSSYQAYGYEPYEAELEEIEPVRDYPPNRRIPGSRDSRRPSRDSYAREPYPEESSRRRPPSRRSSSKPGAGSKSRPRPSRPSESSRRPSSSYDGWEEPGYQDDRAFDRPATRSGPARSSNGRPPSGSKRSRPSSNPYSTASRDSRVDATPVDYTDYDRPSSSRSSDNYDDNSGNYWDGRSSKAKRSSKKNLDLGTTPTSYDDYSSSSYSDSTSDNEDTDRTSTDYTQYPYAKPPTSKPKKDLDLKSTPSDYDDYSSVDYTEDDDSTDRYDNY